MNKNMNTEFQKGNILKLLIKLAVPAIVAQLINALYNIVDRMYLGHIPGDGGYSLTGVGLTFPIIILISAFASLIGMGGAPLTSIKLGEQDKEGAERILGTAFSSLILVGIILTIVFLIFKNDFLMMFGASDITLPYANKYITIYLYGTIFVMLSLGLNAFITAQGFAKMGMLTVLIGAITNIVLDPIFIFGFNMGVEGAALATIIAQLLSALWVLKFLFSKKSSIRIKPKYFKINFKILGSVTALGFAPFIMQSTESLVQITLNSNLQVYGGMQGDQYVGVMTILSSLMQVLTMPLVGLTQGAQPIIGYNYGAKNFTRVKKAIKYNVLLCFAYSCSIWIIAMLFPKMFFNIFTSEQAIINLGIPALRIFLFGIFAMGAQIACQNSFIALGKAKTAALLAMVRKIVLLIPLAIILPKFLGVNGVFIAEPISDILATITTVTVFTINIKVLKALE